MPIVEMPPQIKLVCDECGESPGSEEFGGYIVYDAADPDKALEESCYHREGDKIFCDNCAYELHKDEA